MYRYYRYSAYGQMKAYGANGALLPATQAPTVDRLYTGQVWDMRARMYYYNARFYEPKMARFMTMDPVREYAGPYAYVQWNPVASTDPTGMLTVPDLGGTAGINSILAPSVQELGWQALLALRAPGRGGMNGPNGGGPGGGAGQADLFGPSGPTLASLADAAVQSAFDRVTANVAERQGGGNSTAANPVLNASTGNAGQAAGTIPGTPVVFDAGAVAGVQEVYLPADTSVSSPGVTLSPGYVDINASAGYWLGVTGGVILANEGYLIYAGGGGMTPFGGASVTYGPGAPASGFSLAFGANAAVAGQVGYSFGPGGGVFYELGIGFPPGVQIVGYYAFGPFGY